MQSARPNFAARLTARAGRCAGLVAVLVATCLTRAQATSAPAIEGSQLGAIHFTPPAGWQSEQQPGRDARVFVSPDSTADRQAAIVVLLTPPLGPSFDFRGRFDKAITSTADPQPITEHGSTLTGKSRQGCETLEQTFAYKNAAGQTVRGRMVAARVGNRLAAFCYLASNQEMFTKHADALLNLLSTVRFEGLPAVVAPATPFPETLPATNPAANSVELQAIEQEKASLRKRLADLESKERAITGALANDPTTGPAPHGPPGGLPATNPAAGSLDVTDRSRDGAGLRTHFPKHTKLVLALTPILPGNRAAQSITCDIDPLPGTVHFIGLAPGAYRLTAKAVTPDDKDWPLKVTASAAPHARDWTDAADIDLSQTQSIGVTDVPK